MAAVRRAGFRPVLQREVKETEPCCVQREQRVQLGISLSRNRASFLQPSLETIAVFPHRRQYHFNILAAVLPLFVCCCTPCAFTCGLCRRLSNQGPLHPAGVTPSSRFVLQGQLTGHITIISICCTVSLTHSLTLKCQSKEKVVDVFGVDGV